MSGPLAFMLFGLFCFWLSAISSEHYFGAGARLTFGTGVASVAIGVGWLTAAL